MLTFAFRIIDAREGKVGMEFSVGHRLKAVRKAKGLSQRALAARSGVTNGTISMAEQDSTSPSVASLKKILDGIPMTLSEFFAPGAEEKKQIFFSGDDLTELSPFAVGAGGATISLRQVGNASTHTIQMLHERYEPGSDTGETAYSHAGEEVGIVIEGSIEITVDGEMRVLTPGDAYLFESRLPHRFRNIGETDCVVVSACTPPSF